MEGIREPVSRQLHRVLRHAVLEHNTTERRQVFPTVLHVGTPGATQALYPAQPPAEDGPMDQSLRTDVVAALLARVRTQPAPLVWLTRPGELCLQDVDAAWLAATRAAGAEAGRALPMVVITRRGWWDPRSGTGRTWRRLRARSSGPGSRT